MSPVDALDAVGGTWARDLTQGDEAMFEWPKRCACGRVFRSEDWATLLHVGTMAVEGDTDLELRTCTCGSTLTVPTTHAPPTHARRGKRRDAASEPRVAVPRSASRRRPA